MLSDTDRAIALNTANSRYTSRVSDILSDIATRKDLQGTDYFGGAERVLLKAEDYGKKATDLNPTNADYHLKLGWLYSIMGDLNRMKSEFRKAWTLDPTNDKLKSYIDSYIDGLRQ